MVMKWIKDDIKLKELILYISKKSENDPKFGAVKLNKILFYADFMMYFNRGKAITNQEYMKLDKGPVPRKLLPIRDELIANKEAILQEKRYFKFSQQRLIPLREPELDLFSGEEIAIVDEIIDILKDENAKSASDLSHQFLGWKAAKDKETIPYQTAYLSNEKLTDEEIEYGLKVAERLSKN